MYPLLLFEVRIVSKKKNSQVIYQLAQRGDIEKLKERITDPHKAELAIFPAIDVGQLEIVREMLKFPGININSVDRVRIFFSWEAQKIVKIARKYTAHIRML